MFELRNSVQRGWRYVVSLSLFAAGIAAIPLAQADDPERKGREEPTEVCREIAQSEEDVREQLADFEEDLADEVDLTSKQETEIAAIFDALAPDLYAIQEEHMSLRQDFVNALGSDKLDRQKLDEARVEGLDLMDRASESMTTAFYDVASVLEPEQRAGFVEVLREWKEGMH